MVLIVTGENGVTTESAPNKCYNFDAVLQPEVTQAEVFDEGMKPIVEHVLKGTAKTFPLSNYGPHNPLNYDVITKNFSPTDFGGRRGGGVRVGR